VRNTGVVPLDRYRIRALRDADFFHRGFTINKSVIEALPSDIRCPDHAVGDTKLRSIQVELIADRLHRSLAYSVATRLFLAMPDLGAHPAFFSADLSSTFARFLRSHSEYSNSY